MKKRPNRPDSPDSTHSAENENRLNQAFENAADSLDLELEADSGPEIETFGIAMMPANTTPHVASYDSGPTGPGIAGSEEEEKIEDLIKAWESTEPDDIPTAWPAMAIDPFFAVGPDWVAKLDGQVLADGHASAEYAQELQNYPPKSPRDVKVNQIDISFEGQNRAVATYRFRETLADGRKFRGNSAMIVVRNPASEWKVLIMTKRTRGVDYFED